ncbi:90 kDa surface protein, partial [Trypanosoma cruzi]
MRRVFCVVLAFALLCCCSCVFAVEGGKEQEPQVTQVNAECAGDGNVARWQLPGRSLWYNCTVEDNGVGKDICGMGDGNCTSEDVERRIKDGAEHGVFTINVSTFTPSAVKSWWESNVETPSQLFRQNLLQQNLWSLENTRPPVAPPQQILNLLTLRIPRMFLLLLKLQLQAALLLTLLLALRPRRRRIPPPLVIFKALHILPLLPLLHPNPYQIQSPQKAATTPPMNLQWSCRKRLLLRHRLSCPRPARTGAQRKAPKRTPPPTPPTLLPAKEMLRRQ